MKLRRIGDGTLICQEQTTLPRRKVMSNEGGSAFMEALTKSAQLKVLNMLAEIPEEELTKTQMAERSGIGRTTLYRIWNDLERMRAIAPTKKVGPVTLYRLNLDSPTVQSLINIKRRLDAVISAVATIEEIKEIQKSAIQDFGEKVPPELGLLMDLQKAGATREGKAVDLASLQIRERKLVEELIETGLIARSENRYYLTSLGATTARGAMQIWTAEGRENINQTLSSVRVALNLISRDMKKFRSETR